MGHSGDERMWDIRDAVLLWLYQQAVQGNRTPHRNAAQIQAAAQWGGAPIEERELADATKALHAAGLITGTNGWGAGFMLPELTPSGEALVASGQSCRPGPAQPINPPTVNHITTHVHAPSQLAIGNRDVEQTLTIGRTDDKLITVADALEAFLAEQEPANADEVRRLALELREVAALPDRDDNRVKVTLASIIGAVASSAGTEIGQQVTTLVLDAMRSLGMG